jgi:hypothetical protein
MRREGSEKMVAMVVVVVVVVVVVAQKHKGIPDSRE